MDLSSMPAVVPADPQANCTQLLLDRVNETPDHPIFAIPAGEGWRDVSATEFYEQVYALAKGFVAAGIKPGDRVTNMNPGGGGYGDPARRTPEARASSTGRTATPASASAPMPSSGTFSNTVT